VNSWSEAPLRIPPNERILFLVALMSAVGKDNSTSLRAHQLQPGVRRLFDGSLVFRASFRSTMTVP